MSARDFIKTQKIGFLGTGNLSQAVLRAFLDSGLVPKENILLANRTERKLLKVAEEFQVRSVATNEQLIEQSDIVIVGVKPQDVYQALEPMASVFHESHVVISLAAGIPLRSLEKLLGGVKKIVRVMPNTAAKIKKSVIAYAGTAAISPHTGWIEELLATMGLVVPVEDGEMMESLTVGASSGIGFVYELMMYWQEWLEERGIDAQVARDITVQVFGAAAAMAEASQLTPLAELQKKVVSFKGVTAAGLDSMRELELERGLRISFEKAALRDRELGQSLQKANL
jgi:pyrroline-5-carboxylate reductase